MKVKRSCISPKKNCNAILLKWLFGDKQMNPESLEIEVKFILPDAEAIRRRMRKLEAHSAGRVFETNIRYEDPANSLIRRKALLRLRQDKKTTLTYKGEPEVNDADYKIFKELEVDVSDFATMGQILESLGYHREQIYEKWRDSYTLNAAACCIDEMPFGTFLEIEGSKKQIKALAAEIGMPWDQRITLTYFELFEILRSQLNLAFKDITFDNFRGISIDPNIFIPSPESRS